MIADFVGMVENLEKLNFRLWILFLIVWHRKSLFVKKWKVEIVAVCCSSISQMPYILVRGNLASYGHRYPWRVLVSGLKGIPHSARIKKKFFFVIFCCKALTNFSCPRTKNSPCAHFFVFVALLRIFFN